MKNNFRKAALSTICMLIVAVMSLTGVTYAWFTAAETATVGGMTMNVDAAEGGFQISETGADGTWVSTINFNANSAKLAPVSTVNATEFFTAVVDANDPTGMTITTSKDTTAANVWTEEFYAKNTGYNSVDVYLATGAIFSDIDTADTKKAYEAARIAIFVDDTLVYIWGAGESNKGVNGEGTTTNYNNIGGIIGEVGALKTALAECKITLPGMDTTTGEAKAVVKKITVKVWVEGQDAQCINQNASDAFNVKLDFTVTAPTGN